MQALAVLSMQDIVGRHGQGDMDMEAGYLVNGLE